MAIAAIPATAKTNCAPTPIAGASALETVTGAEVVAVAEAVVAAAVVAALVVEAVA